jgi:hypothetical protein
MPEVSLQGARIVALVRERVTACVPEHVRVSLEAELASPLDHASEASGAEGGRRRRRLPAYVGPFAKDRSSGVDWSGIECNDCTCTR